MLGFIEQRYCYTMKGIMIILKCVVVVISGILINLNDRNKVTEVGNHVMSCVEPILKQEFSQFQSVLAILMKGKHDPREEMFNIMLHTIHKSSLFPLFMTHNSHFANDKISGYIIMVFPDSKINYTINNQLHSLSRSSNWNSRANFFVIFIDLLEEELHTLTLEIMKILWEEYDILNILVLVPVMDSDSLEFYLYSWFPYQSSNQCEKCLETTLLDRCVFGEKWKLNLGVQLYPNKIPRNFHGCPIEVVNSEPLENIEYKKKNTFENYSANFIPNIETFTEKWNITLKKVPNLTNSTLKSWRYISVLHELFIKRAEIVMGVLLLMEELGKYAEFTVPFLDTNIIWYVPCAKKLSTVGTIYRVFSLSSWILIILSFILSIVIMWQLAVNSKKGQEKKPEMFMEISNCAYSILAIALGISVPEMPHSIATSLFFLFLVCYFFALSIVFQTFFTSLLVDPGFEHQIKTTNELFESNMNFGFPQTYEFLSEHKTEIQLKMKNRKETPCLSTFHCLQKLHKEENFATFLSGVPYRISRIIDKHESLCVLEDRTVQVRGTLYVRKNLFFLEHLNKVIQWYIEAGILNIEFCYIVSHINKHLSNLQEPTLQPSSKEEYFAFTIEHLGIAFYMLFIGLFWSLIVFVCEFTCHHFKLI